MRISHLFLVVSAMVVLNSGCLETPLTDAQIDKKICEANTSTCSGKDVSSGEIVDSPDTSESDVGFTDVSNIDTKSSDVQGDTGIDVNKEDTPDSSGVDFDIGGDSEGDAEDGADAPDSVSNTDADTIVFDDTPDSLGDISQDGGDVQGDVGVDEFDTNKEDADDGVNSPDAVSNTDGGNTDAGQDDTNLGDTQVSPDTSSDAGSQDADASSDSTSDTSSSDTSNPDINQLDTFVPKCTTASCDDNNLCTDDACDMAVGCTFTNNTKTCNDGNVCTQKDQCSAGKCQGEVKLCNDSNACTTDSCDKAKGCLFVNNTNACNDGSACTVSDKCDGGKCVGKTNTCDDNDICTVDSCDKKKGCSNILKNGCQKCKITADCNDGNDCTNDACGGGQCFFFGKNGLSCSDGDACTKGDICKGHSCTAKPKICNDGNKCTTDSCDKLKGCIFDYNATPCDDGKVCTVNDACNSGSCKGKAKVCNDGNGCTDDSCNEKSGCVTSFNNSSCSNGDACTSSDKCAAGTCKAGTSKTCDDKDACTLDTCDSKTGKCVFTQKKNCWVKIWNPVVKPGLTMGKYIWYNNNVSLWASQPGEKHKEPMWRFTNIPYIDSFIDDSTFNFSARESFYCGHPNCLDTSNPKNVVGGTVEFPQEYDFITYQGVRVTIRYISRMDTTPDIVTIQASTDGFAKIKVDGTCAAATAKTTGTLSYTINFNQTPKQIVYKSWHWKFVTVYVPYAAGKKGVKLRLHFASCDAKGNEGFLAINYLSLEATKLK